MRGGRILHPRPAGDRAHLRPAALGGYRLAGNDCEHRYAQPDRQPIALSGPREQLRSAIGDRMPDRPAATAASPRPGSTGSRPSVNSGSRSPAPNTSSSERTPPDRSRHPTGSSQLPRRTPPRVGGRPSTRSAGHPGRRRGRAGGTHWMPLPRHLASRSPRRPRVHRRRCPRGRPAGTWPRGRRTRGHRARGGRARGHWSRGRGTRGHRARGRRPGIRLLGARQPRRSHHAAHPGRRDPLLSRDRDRLRPPRAVSRMGPISRQTTRVSGNRAPVRQLCGRTTDRRAYVRQRGRRGAGAARATGCGCRAGDGVRVQRGRRVRVLRGRRGAGAARATGAVQRGRRGAGAARATGAGARGWPGARDAGGIGQAEIRSR